MGNIIARYITVSGMKFYQKWNLGEQSGSNQNWVFRLGSQSFTLGIIQRKLF